MKRRDECGAVVLESTYCILISIFVLMFMLSFGLVPSRIMRKIVCRLRLNEVSRQ